jgi:CheY-like chemotaxis protein
MSAPENNNGPQGSLPHHGRLPAILIVDDEPSIIETVSLTLKHAGYHATGVLSGEACLEALQNGFKGVILMDISMPDMDGWTTIDRIVSAGLIQGNIICMLTGITAPDPRADKLESYVMDYLAKPFTPEELFAMVESAAQYLES